MSDVPKPYYGPTNATWFDVQIERTFVAGDFICGVGYGVQLVLYASCFIFLKASLYSNGRPPPRSPSTSHSLSLSLNSLRVTLSYLNPVHLIRDRVGAMNRRTLLLLGYITLLILNATLFGAVQAYTVQDMYVDNRNYPGGPWIYFLDTQYLAHNVMFYATLFVGTFLADLLVLWRCWVIWSGSGRGVALLVISFPSLMILASFVMGTLWTLQSSQPGLSLYSALPMAYGTSYYAISLSVNIVLTILITIRLLVYRQRATKIWKHAASAQTGYDSSLPAESARFIEGAGASPTTVPSEKQTAGAKPTFEDLSTEAINDKLNAQNNVSTDAGGRHYYSLATIFVESAALYSVFAFIFIVTYAINHPVNQIFLGVATNAQQIAGYLIIYRVAQGRAWSSHTTQGGLPSRPGRRSKNRHGHAEEGRATQGLESIKFVSGPGRPNDALLSTMMSTATRRTVDRESKENTTVQVVVPNDNESVIEVRSGRNGMKDRD